MRNLVMSFLALSGRPGRLLLILGMLLVSFQPVVLTEAAAAAPCPPGFLSEAQSSSNPNCATSSSGATVNAAVLPPNFQESIVFSGLTQPTNIKFAADGRVFVAQKNGLIKVFASLTATTPTVFADLHTEVDDFWDRGLLGLALDPNFPTNPYVYVLYTYDAPIGGTAPVWNDACPTPPGATTDGCMVSGRLSKLTADASGNTMLSEQVLINDWCQQFPSHSIGQLNFGPDGALYVSGGDGASFNNVDYGQYGNTYAGDNLNPCGDPPTGVGGAETPPTAEGGALRSQSLQRAAGHPAALNGTILRVDPATGLGLPTNPLYSSSDANARRIVSYGMRNPFRFTFRPGTSELWVGDVGWSTWEEVNRIINPTAAPLQNFGWPCYEGDNSGSAIQSGYQAAGLTICSNLYNTAGSVTAPYYAYQHGVSVVSGDGCPTASGSVISAISFYASGSYPNSYNGALFFGDHSRNCIWVMPAGSNGLPDKTKIATFVGGAANPVDLETGPGGDVFYVDFDGGTIRRIQYVGNAGQPPVAVITTDKTSGPAPLTVNFDGSSSSSPNPGGSISAYAWDFNGDGIVDSTAASAAYTYAAGNYTASLTVTDNKGLTNTATVAISANNTAPVAVIDTPAACPAAAPCWIVGQTINFSGHATDQQDGTLPASALAWAIILHHCPTNISQCHTHTLQTLSGIASGSFSAPDHDYPAYLEIQLTATDAGGLTNTTSVLLYPQTVNLNFNSSPTGLQLAINGTSAAAPFTHTVIINSSNSVSANTPQDLNGVRYAFQSWSDGGAQTHTVTAGTTDASLTATYNPISADVGIVKTGVLSANKANITYTLTVTNHGPGPAASTVTTDTLPTNRIQFVSAASTQGSCSGASTVTCALGTLASQQVVKVTIVVNVLKNTGVSVTNTASVSTTSPDLNSANNSASIQTRLR